MSYYEQLHHEKPILILNQPSWDSDVLILSPHFEQIVQLVGALNFLPLLSDTDRNDDAIKTLQKLLLLITIIVQTNDENVYTRIFSLLL